MTAAVSSPGDIYDANGTLIIAGARLASAASGNVLTVDANGNLSPQPPAGGGAVTSVFGRTGAVTAQSADIPNNAANTTGNAATATNLAGGATFPAYVAPKVVTLTFGASIAVNAALGNIFAVTLTASTGTLANPTNPVDGQLIRVRVAQDATGGWTLAYGTAYDWGAAGAPTLSTAASKVDILVFEYNAALSKWCGSSALGF